MKRGRPFVVGRRTRKSTTLVLLEPQQAKPVIRGPWTVRAVVTPEPPR